MDELAFRLRSGSFLSVSVMCANNNIYNNARTSSSMQNVPTSSTNLYRARYSVLTISVATLYSDVVMFNHTSIIPIYIVVIQLDVGILYIGDCMI